MFLLDEAATRKS